MSTGPAEKAIGGARSQKRVRNAVAQAVLNELLQRRKHTTFHYVWRRLLLRSRMYLITYGDPLVRYELDGHTLWLPISHELPLYRSDLPEYSRNVGRIAACVAEQYADFTLVDIGANIGDTLAVVRSFRHFPVLCVEGEDRFFSILKLNAASMGADVEYTICSVCGNKARDILQYCGHIPQLKGRQIDVIDRVAGRRRRWGRTSSWSAHLFEANAWEEQS